MKSRCNISNKDITIRYLKGHKSKKQTKKQTIVRLRKTIAKAKVKVKSKVRVKFKREAGIRVRRKTKIQVKTLACF